MSQNLQSEGCSHQDIEKAIPSISESVVIHTEAQEADNLPLTNSNLPTNTYKPLICIVFFVTLIVAVVIAIFLFRQGQNGGEIPYIEGRAEFNTTLGLKFTWFQQKLDHSDSNSAVWWQRLFFKNHGSNFNSTSPIFLYLPPFQYSKNYLKSSSLIELAQRIQGLTLTLQPRYFGQSLPFGPLSLTTQNLRYLTIDQMIEDIAHLIRRTSELNILGITKDNPWIVNGAMVTGTIAIWFRSKYPDLTAGAFASSPIIPTLLVPQVGVRSYNSVKNGGRKCRTAIQKLKEEFEAKIFGENQAAAIEIYSEGVKMTAQQVAYMVESRLLQIPRDLYYAFCIRYKQEDVTKIFKELIYIQDSRNFDPIAYSQEELSNINTYQVVEAVRNHRAIWYIRCAEIALFEIASLNKTLISDQLTEQFFRDHCQAIFQTPIWPDPTKLVNRYESYVNTATKIAITHGSFDSWLDYAIMPENNTQIELLMMNCSICQTASDMQRESTKAKIILETQSKQKDLAKKWLLQALQGK